MLALTVRAVLPVEVLAFAVMILAVDVGPLAWIGIALYIGCEFVKTYSGRFRVTTFKTEGQPYIPFVEENFYKAWGPS